MSFRTPTSQNVYLPDWKATGQVISFVRDPNSFALNRYVQNIPTKKPNAVYLYMHADHPVRVFNRDMYKWPDGAERPRFENNQQPFEFREAITERYDYGWALGRQTIDNADWQIRAQYSENEMVRATLSRLIEICQQIDTVANWGTSTATADSLNGGAGYFDQASSDEADPHFLAIRKAFVRAARTIHLKTNGRVRPKDLKAVVNPTDAEKMADTSEIYHFRKYGPYAKDAQEGDDPAIDEMWGLPRRYAGIELVVEDANYVSTMPTAAMGDGTNQYIKESGKVAIVARPGSLDGKYGSQNFSTLQCFYYTGETSGGLLVVETFEDTENKRTVGHVVEQYKCSLVAPVSGYLIQECFLP